MAQVQSGWRRQDTFGPRLKLGYELGFGDEWAKGVNLGAFTMV
jgi:hypothetical protein